MTRKWCFVLEGIGAAPAGQTWTTLASGRGTAGGDVFRGSAVVAVAIPAPTDPPVLQRQRRITVIINVQNRSGNITPIVLTSVIARLS
jgi:hypothetical protein